MVFAVLQGIGQKTCFSSSTRWFKLEAPGKKGTLMMKLQQILLFRSRAPGLCGPKGFKLEAP
jgi:hypothetical protein